MVRGTEGPKSMGHGGSPKQEERERESDVASSGVRIERERETTPAPPGADAMDEWDALPSARPTSVPDYDVAAVAFETSLRHHALPSLPLDVAVPTRTRLGVPADLELRASFLLLHSDGHSSVRDIADLTGLPLEDVLTCFLSLTAQGLVELGGTRGAQGVPVSGERRKT
jgi:hypothetical protein